MAVSSIRPTAAATASIYVSVLLFVSVAAQGAGRAFPVAAENFAIDYFQRINHNINWDHTNFLIDLSGQYATCTALRSPLGLINIQRRTLEGYPIVGVVDAIAGSSGDAGSAVVYIEEIMKQWKPRSVYYTQIQQSNCFGCSIRPMCTNQAVVACLFANSSTCSVQRDWPTRPPAPVEPIRATPAPRIQLPLRPSLVIPTPSTTGEVDRPIGIQKALAFTLEQYKVAEVLIGKPWDRSHYLENLSGFETDCGMINNRWYFTYTAQFNRQNNRPIHGQYGFAQNRGSTPNALQEIIDSFTKIPHARDLGCSIIPDCIEARTGTMYVVVACLHEE